MGYDMFDNGIPKYSSAADIYDALREMASGEEIGILSEMFADVSWEGQDYYYTDNGYKLFEQWEEKTEYGDKIWLMDVAIWQMSNGDANDWIYQILCNDDLAKKIGFKKIFIDNVLSGLKHSYEQAVEAFEEELQELDRFDFYANTKALDNALRSMGWQVIMSPYGNLCEAVYKKLKGLRLDDEKQLIIESRAMLTGYDDFMFGLRANQNLYKTQEQMYQSKVALLQEKYEMATRQLLSMAQEQGLMLRLPSEPLLIGGVNNEN
jgi:L-fucose mutarotase/ribose pyranase (RbsD/FucU family)